MNMGGRRFKKITYPFVIIALLLLPAFSVVSALNSRVTVTGAELPDGGGRWIRGVATWMTYTTNPFEPNRLELSANVIASLPLEEMQLVYVWEIDGSMIRTEKNTTVYIDNIGIKKIVHVRLTVCSERSNSCAVHDKDIQLMNWPVMITVSSFFSILIISIAMYQEKWRKRFRRWV